jgi:hypothetical protein
MFRLTDHEFSCEGPVELAASTAAGRRPSLLFITMGAAPRTPTSPVVTRGLRQLQLEVSQPALVHLKLAAAQTWRLISSA